MIIRQGGVVAFPTETYYGLAADPFNQSALKLLFSLKQRDYTKPVLTLVAVTEQLSLLARDVPDIYSSLIKRFWPGPLTLIFPAQDILPILLTGRTGTVGVRISSHPAAQALVKLLQGPVTATSANISGHKPAIDAQEVRRQFGSSLDYIVDGGRTPGGSGSTIIGQEAGSLKLIRAGVIPFEQLLTG